MRQIRIAFCGCGRIAAAHAKVLQKLDAVTLRAYWNRPQEARLAQALFNEFGGEYVATDYSNIAADPEIDAVYLCTMHNDRLPILQTMAEAGKPVFMEKPLTHNAATLRAMHRLLTRKPILFQAGYKLRFHSMVRKAQELLPKPEILQAHVFDETWPPGHLNDISITGGNVRSQGVYAADILHVLAGSTPVAVTAMAANLRQSSGIEDTLVATFEFADGALGSLTVADAGTMPDPVSKFLAVAAGGNRSVALFDRYKRLDFLDGREPVPTSFVGEEDGFRRQSESFLAAVRGEKAVECGFMDGAVPSIMIYSAIEAARLGRRVRIDVPSWLEEE